MLHLHPLFNMEPRLMAISKFVKHMGFFPRSRGCKKHLSIFDEMTPHFYSFFMIKYNLSKSTPPFSLLNFPFLLMNPTLFARQLIISLWLKSYQKPNSQDFPMISPWFPYIFLMFSIAPWPPFRLRWPISSARCAVPRRPAPGGPALCPRGPWFLNQ